ncbi:MAG: Smr/MutS family protein [Alphaproteobacteria bacterium]|nr:Smr/MutS family protein [Alphaproteobacteria bacterium]
MKKDRKSGTSDEDRALWQHVTRSVRAYEKRRGDTAEKRRTAADDKTAKADAKKNVAVKKPSDITPAGKPAVRITPAPRQPLPPPLPDDGTAQSLRKKKWPIDKTLDLHGMTQAAAHQALLRFVAAAVRQERRTLLVITGKGSRLAGGGVLRRLLPLWLEEPPLRAKVLACTPARPEDGGDGAFYVRLRKKKD